MVVADSEEKKGGRRMDESIRGGMYGYAELAAQLEGLPVPSHARKKDIPKLLVKVGGLRELAKIAVDRLRVAEEDNSAAVARAEEASHALAVRETQMGVMLEELREEARLGTSVEEELSSSLKQAQKEAKEQREAAEASSARHKEVVQRLESTLARKDTLLAKRNKEVADLEAKLAAANAKHASADDATKRALIQVAEAKRRAVKAETALASAQATRDSAAASAAMASKTAESEEMKALRADRARKARLVNDLKARVAELTAENEKLGAKVGKRSRYKDLLAEAQADEERMHEHSNAQKARIDKLVHELRATQLELGTVHARFKKLQRVHGKLKKRVAGGGGAGGGVSPSTRSKPSARPSSPI